MLRPGAPARGTTGGPVAGSGPLQVASMMLHGTAAGDLTLQYFAALLRSHCRAVETVFHFSGDEFRAVLQAADHAVAQRAAGRILQALREHPCACRTVARPACG